MELSVCQQFWLEDSSSDDDSDVETMMATRRQQMLVVVLAVKEFQETRRRRLKGSMLGRLCIPRNRVYGNELLMRDYFTDIPTYPPNFFYRRYRTHRSLFVKIVEACMAIYCYFTHRRNTDGLLGFIPY